MAKWKRPKVPLGHRFDKRIVGFSYCSRCGLIALRNKATKKALRRCDADYDEDD